MFTIHVVNSVKGGCGKSTFCLFLENYLLEKQENYTKEIDEDKKKNLVNHNPIIIDLDLSGSSWYRNNKEFLEIKDVKFIDDLIEDFNRNIKQEYIFSIKEGITDMGGEGGNERVLKRRTLEIVMADPDRAGSIKDEELDLFENSICRLIQALVDKGKTDIILDMPPGYEDYTERIVKHLLFDLSSPLYKKYVIPKSNKTEYEVKIYMLSGIDGAMEGNAKYIKDFHIKANYSAATENLSADNIYFVINDILNVYKTLEGREPDYNNLKNLVHKNLSSIYSFDLSHVFVTKRFESNSLINIVGAILNGSQSNKEFLNIMKPDFDIFYSVFNEIFIN